MKGKRRILLQESEPSLRRVLELSLVKSGLDITAVEDYQLAQMQLQDSYDAFIIEYSPQSLCGTFINRARSSTSENNFPVFLITTTCRPGEEWRRTYKPDLVFYKPFDIRYLERKLLEVLDERKESGKTNG
ncbi:MAG: response regulator [Anaerolineales bacterium]|nr:response regulator [Anaerolineales bacterium]